MIWQMASPGNSSARSNISTWKNPTSPPKACTRSCRGPKRWKHSICWKIVTIACTSRTVSEPLCKFVSYADQPFATALHPAWNNLFRNHPIAALAALAQQKDSLKSLTYGPQYDENASVERDPFDRTPVYEVHAGFAEFIALEYVKLVDDCPIFEQAVLSAKAPPNLKVLAVESGMPFPLFHHKVTPESVLQETSFFSAPSCSRPERFQRLELTFPLYSYEDLSHLDIVSGEHHDLLIQLANGLKAIGADLIVYTKREAGSDGSHNTSYFPPYLDGEPTPRVDLYFDGTDFVGKPK